MKEKASSIFAAFREQGVLSAMQGEDTLVSNIAPVDGAGPGDLVFVDSRKFVQDVLDAQPSAVVTSKALAAFFLNLTTTTVLTSPNVNLAQALLRQKYADRNVRDTEWPRIHPSAVVHDSVVLSSDAVLGPGVVLGAHVHIGSATVIMANVVVERDACIGERTVVHPSVVIGYGCQVGNRVVLKSGCVIGSEGFGFAQDEQHKSHRIPQVGTVVIEDDVVIGANCTVDRATYRETRISSGCKLDALCHVAHNVFMDNDCIIVGQTGVSGSSRLGKRVIASGQTGVLDHITITDDVVLVHRCGVTQNIDEPGIYAAGPAQPLQSYKKNIGVFKRLFELRARVKSLEEKIARLSESEKNRG